MREKAMEWVYATCLLGIFASILVQELPPCVDYPQHLALAKQLEDFFLGQGEGHWVIWNYNGFLQ